MTSVLLVIAIIWIADGVALLVAPVRIIGLLKSTIEVSRSLIKWSGFTAFLGFILLMSSDELSYQPLWYLIGLLMIVKGLFLVWASESLRDGVVEWCFTRDPIDYRFWGLGLCTLSVLLLDALGWIRSW